MPAGLHVGILLPVIEVTIHVIDVHVNDSAFHFDIHGLFISESVITPPCEVTMESFTKSITDHVSCPVLMSSCYLLQFVSIECLSVSDSNIHFIFNSTTCQLIL